MKNEALPFLSLVVYVLGIGALRCWKAPTSWDSGWCRYALTSAYDIPSSRWPEKARLVNLKFTCAEMFTYTRIFTYHSIFKYTRKSSLLSFSRTFYSSLSQSSSKFVIRSYARYDFTSAHKLNVTGEGVWMDLHWPSIHFTSDHVQMAYFGMYVFSSWDTRWLAISRWQRKTTLFIRWNWKAFIWGSGKRDTGVICLYWLQSKNWE